MNKEIFICHNCPMTRTMATIGTKWKPIIIYTIGLKRRRFGQIFRLNGYYIKEGSDGTTERTGRRWYCAAGRI